ncbi:hypothetical protein GE21DRAFT_1236 [Neurospora crassa]|uniref:Uncharacterized protein n=1 Tax=Neurospora crassa (strain ATCC 24698 / 74-OR23-1A / CBS 708.71 / DSM 1257 / FGSC 987) TaxID=367110 RepID=A7UW90_NEUCR|nr:hypothetical protein NCU10621 [Neurospora crassa OR74A]EDO65287.1 hypothetical protein NCU10621 [Neurospora crassa OR74A]KHE86041.1 hypothetical protein GE21DRAFT_1236 [Neurospora crassa]|eukprot:XP_001728378.1 hypothetical protein NCU10621 [Neurospora crassa OR74A]
MTAQARASASNPPARQKEAKIGNLAGRGFAHHAIHGLREPRDGTVIVVVVVDDRMFLSWNAAAGRKEPHHLPQYIHEDPLAVMCKMNYGICALPEISPFWAIPTMMMKSGGGVFRRRTARQAKAAFSWKESAPLLSICFFWATGANHVLPWLGAKLPWDVAGWGIEGMERPLGRAKATSSPTSFSTNGAPWPVAAPAFLCTHCRWLEGRGEEKGGSSSS